MPNDSTPRPVHDDDRPDASRHPGYGPLCDQCGTAAEAGDHWNVCHRMQERPGLWADGWVDLAAFGLDERSAAGWPEVRTGPVPVVVEGGLGPQGIRASKGPWVRHPDPAVPTWQRVAALRVLQAAGDEPAQAVAKVIAAPLVQVDAWRRPRVVVIRTAGCGATHYVRIERGLPPARHRCEPSARDRGEVLWRFSSPARCEEVVARWRTADVGTVQVDITGGGAPRYRRIRHDVGVLAAQRVFVAATLARVRGTFIESGEPDRWLVLEGSPSPLGTLALIHESTRPLPIALVTAPPTWLWSTDPLV